MRYGFNVPEPPIESCEFIAYHAPEGTKNLPLYFYHWFLATPRWLIWRSAITKGQLIQRSNGQWAGYPEVWDLEISVGQDTLVTFRNVSPNGIEKLRAFLTGWLSS